MVWGVEVGGVGAVGGGGWVVVGTLTAWFGYWTGHACGGCAFLRVRARDGAPLYGGLGRVLVCAYLCAQLCAQSFAHVWIYESSRDRVRRLARGCVENFFA